MPAPKKTLPQKLAAIMAEVGRIPKRGMNTHFGYAYATEMDIVEAIRQKLADHQVMLVPSVTDVTREGTLTTVRLRYTLLDGEAPDYSTAITFDWAGTGSDNADKGLYKAFTGAQKYALLKLFMVPTGDDPETASGPAPEPTVGPATRPVQPQRVPAGDGLVQVAHVEERETKTGGQMWKVTFSDRAMFNTFDGVLAQVCYTLQNSGADCRYTTIRNGKYQNLVTVEPVGEASAAPLAGPPVDIDDNDIPF